MVPAGIIATPDGLHEQCPSDTTIPSWAMGAVVVLSSVMLKGIGAPPGRRAVGPGAVMVTSMPPADPFVVAWGAEADVGAAEPDGDGDGPVVVVVEAVGVLGLVLVPVVPEF
jgi:hypothetical protein